MGDRATLEKARRELEELYLGVPDDSVNLTFQDFAQISSQNHHVTSSSSSSSSSSGGKKKKPTNTTTTTKKKKMDPIMESNPNTPKHHHQLPPTTHNHNHNHNLTKIPSLDFSRGLEAAASTAGHHVTAESPVFSLPAGGGYRHQVEEVVVVQQGKRGNHLSHGHGMIKSHGHVKENNNSSGMMMYDDMSMMSMASMYQEKSGGIAGRRRPGIPHSNICTVCTVYIYMFRNRCLVCGRVYCRQCLNLGMGEMTEGRKCLDCLGRKFSQRYIHRAGNVGCWSTCFNGYPSEVKIQELKWAEKGPRRSAENNRSIMMSKSRSPLGGPRTPSRAHYPSGPPSFVTTPDYTPYATPTRHHLPF